MADGPRLARGLNPWGRHRTPSTISPRLKPRLRTRRWLDCAGAPKTWSMKLLPRLRVCSSKLCSARRLKGREMGRGACNCRGEPSLAGFADGGACQVLALCWFMLTPVIWDMVWKELPSPIPSPMCRDCDFWCADARMLARSSAGGGLKPLVNCDSGFPACIVVAVLVASETFMSRVEKLDAPCENGEESLLGREDGGSSGEDCNGEGERRRRR